MIVPRISSGAAEAVEESAPLLGFWYRAVPAARVRAGRMVKVLIHDLPLLVGRTRDGAPFALLDECPHRGMPLSHGTLRENCVECCYHGWKFDVHNGQCRSIPSLISGQELKIEKIHVRGFAAADRDDFVWTYFPAHDRAVRDRDPPGTPPALPTRSEGHRRFRLSYQVPIAADHAITSLMDPAHGPFVHGTWWRRSRLAFGIGASSAADPVAREGEVQRVFAPIPLGFRTETEAPLPKWPAAGLLRVLAGADVVRSTIDFELPSVRTEHIRAGRIWFSSLTTVAPITPGRCRIDIVAASNLFGKIPLAMSIGKTIFKIFFSQDCRALERQAEGLRRGARMMLIDDADRPARWYYQLKHAHREAARTGSPLVHPLAAPVILNWRAAVNP